MLGNYYGVDYFSIVSLRGPHCVSGIVRLFARGNQGQRHPLPLSVQVFPKAHGLVVSAHDGSSDDTLVQAMNPPPGCAIALDADRLKLTKLKAKKSLSRLRMAISPIIRMDFLNSVTKRIVIRCYPFAYVCQYSECSHQAIRSIVWPHTSFSNGAPTGRRAAR